jgi:hypothetical protein
MIDDLLKKRNISKGDLFTYLNQQSKYLINIYESHDNEYHNFYMNLIQELVGDMSDGLVPKFIVVDNNQIDHKSDLFYKVGIDQFLIEAQFDLRDTLRVGVDGKGNNPNFPLDDNYIDKLKKYKKPYYFLSYNNFPKKHRLYFLQESIKRNFFDKGIISFRDPDTQIYPELDDDQFIDNFYGLLDFNFIGNEISKILPLELDTVENSDGSGSGGISDFGVYHPGRKRSFRRDRYVHPPHITDSYFNVVCESIFSKDNNLFITEKTYKAVLLQPFIILGSPFTLKKIRSYGFETFPELFDESYDSIVSPGERIQFIIKEIEKVCSLNKDELHDIYLKILPKVIHNQQHFLNMDIKDLVFDVWNKIFIDQTGTYE